MSKRLALLLSTAAFPLVVPALSIFGTPSLPAAAAQVPPDQPSAKKVAEQVAQKEASTTDPDPIARIKVEEAERSQVMETLSYLTDVIGPRLTASSGMKRANEWTRDTLTKWGMENAHLESWGPFGRGWTLKRFSAQVIEPQCIPLIGYPKAWSPGTDGPVTGPVVYLDATDEEGLEKFKGTLKGAIVLVGAVREPKAWFDPPGMRLDDKRLLDLADAGEPSAGGRRGGSPFETKKADSKKGEAAKGEAAKKDQPRPGIPGGAALTFAPKRFQFLIDEGAAVMVDVSSRGDGGTLFVQQATVPTPPATQPTPPAGVQAIPRVSPWAKDAPKSLPQVTLGIESFNRLARAAKLGEAMKATIEIAAEFEDADPMGYNTIAEIPGTDLKDEIVMLGGHLDSWHSGTGATDNAAGCAVGMEAIRLIKALELKPRRTIRLALWSGEEQGLYGSRAYVADHFASFGPGGGSNAMASAFGGQRGPLTKKPEYDKFSAYFNLDNGTGKIRGVYLQGNEACRAIFRKWLQPFRELDAQTITLSNTGGTDHQSFDAVGLPGFQFIQDPVEYDTRTHHSNMDVYDRCQPDDLKQASAIMAAFIYNAAMADEKLPRKPMPAATTAAGR